MKYNEDNIVFDQLINLWSDWSFITRSYDQIINYFIFLKIDFFVFSSMKK